MFEQTIRERVAEVVRVDAERQEAAAAHKAARARLKAAEEAHEAAVATLSEAVGPGLFRLDGRYYRLNRLWDVPRLEQVRVFDVADPADLAAMRPATPGEVSPSGIVVTGPTGYPNAGWLTADEVRASAPGG